MRTTMQKNLQLFFILFTLFSSVTTFAQSQEAPTNASFPALIERYILDELKAIRSDEQKLRNDVEKRISRAEVEQTDRAARYVTDTIGNIFYLIAAATSILIFAGWNSLRDIRKKVEEMIELRVEQITLKYNEKLQSLEQSLTDQSAKILDNQNKIYTTQLSHSLWMRANLETNIQSKIEIYDEILRVNPEDAEAYAYKADAVLDLDQFEWALNLSNKAIEIDVEYGYAYWQRACAHAKIGQFDLAISDLNTALQKNPSLKDDIAHEPSFEQLKDFSAFQNTTAC